MADNGMTSVLVVDDDPRARELMRLLLSADGYRVQTADDGQAALDAIPAHRPDIVVVDLVMPGMDGLAFCRSARQAAAPATLAILVLTGMDDADVRRSAREAGADAVMTKPFDRRALRECLARLCQLNRRPCPRRDP